MFRRLIAAAFLFGTPANAQLSMTGAGGGIASSSSPPPSYTGPGDIFASAAAWYGVRAYSAAVAATGTQKAFNILRASDSALQDIVILTSGVVDVAGYNTFVGTDATASCTIAGTSAVCTGASATLHVNDPITGAGITNPCVVSATNGSTTATVSIAGTSTNCGTVSVAETVTFQVAGFIPKAYDQSGNTRDAPQVTPANQPQFLPNCVNALPCVWFNGNQWWVMPTFSVAQPFSLSVVSIQNNSTAAQEIIRSGNPTFYRYNGASGEMFAGSTATTFFTVLNVWTASNMIFTGASSFLNHNGVSASTSPGTNGISGATTQIGASSGEPLKGNLTEIGVWGAGTTAGNRTSTCQNQQAIYGAGNFSAAC